MTRLRFLVGILLGLSLLISLVAPGFAQQQTVTVQVNPVGGSGVSGTATLTAMDGTTQVTLSLSGFQPNTSHATHIHDGQCPTPGGIVFDLPTLTADANGVATATGIVNTPLTSLMDGNHVVQTHVAGPPNFGSGIACGNIPAAAAPAAPTPEEAVEVAVTPTVTAPVAAAPGVTGGPAPLAAAALLSALGLSALGGGVLLRRR